MELSLNIPIKGRVKACLDLIKPFNLKGKVVVDIGSSVGWVERALANSGAKEIIGIEPNKQALEFAKKDIKGPKFILGDALNIPLKDQYADFVFLFDVLEHVPKETELKALKEIRRVLKENGLLLLSTPNDNFFIKTLDPAWYFGHRHYSISCVKKLLENEGFELLSLTLRGNILSSIYVIWLYITKFLTGSTQPRSYFFESLEEKGYKMGKIGTIFLEARAK